MKGHLTFWFYFHILFTSFSDIILQLKHFVKLYSRLYFNILWQANVGRETLNQRSRTRLGKVINHEYE